jgi:hypothetical protein
MAREQQPALLLMDIKLPGINGVEAFCELRANPATRAIPGRGGHGGDGSLDSRQVSSVIGPRIVAAPLTSMTTTDKIVLVVV